MYLHLGRDYVLNSRDIIGIFSLETTTVSPRGRSFLEYAQKNGAVVSLSDELPHGFPFLIFATGCSMLIRADGSPKFAMYSILSGAFLNIILDALFIIHLDMGMAGAAYATIIGQILSAVCVFCYLFRFKQIDLSLRDFVPKLVFFKRIIALGCASCFNQAALERLVLEGQGSDPCTLLSSGEATTTLLNPALGIPV